MSAIVSVTKRKTHIKDILYIDVGVKDENGKLKATSLRFDNENEWNEVYYNVTKKLKELSR